VSARVGEVTGTITLALDGGSPPPMLSPYARRRYSPPSASRVAASTEDVVVYIVVGSGARASREATITQRDRTILPHVTVVQTGTTIHFPNEDEVFHNLFSLSGPKQFNLGRYEPGDSRSVTFDRAGVVRMFCDIHSEMSGTILVLDTPYFAKGDAGGRFRIPNVPAGRHTLVAWHEGAGEVRRQITVADGRATAVDVELPG
jgi:plastocyanin